MFAVVSFVVSASAWAVQRLSTRTVIAGSVAGSAVAVMASVAGIDGYPWSNVVVLMVAVAGGVGVGRWVTPTARAMFLLLAVLSALDLSQLLWAGGTRAQGPAPWETWFHLLVLAADGTPILKIGVVDLLLVAAVAEHWRRRGAGFWLAALTGPVGLALSSGYAWVVRPAGGMVLVPFVFVGWSMSELWWRRHRRRAVP